MRPARRSTVAAALIGLALVTRAGGEPLCAGSEAVRAPGARPVQARGTLSALVVFARFQGETGVDERAPEWAADLFNPSRPGSFSHFYHEMSGGQLEVRGEVLPKRYTSRLPASAYAAAANGEMGRFGQFNREILEQVDRDVDLGRFDNDGPDGVPNSGDDDGYVDIAFINLQSVPRGFFIGGATGYASLGLDTDLRTGDPAARGGVIRFRSRFSGFAGTTQRGHTFSVTAATLCHEFGHVLGLPDLFDQSAVTATGQVDPAEESAGIGKWGLMGLGTLGWGVEDGPNAFCAWSLARLGWLGPGNERLVEVRRSQTDLVAEDLMQGGLVYRIPVSQDEYYLLEYRRRDGSYYNRNIPADGLLIWHVDERADNDEERHKQVDLVCADGLYADQGYPSGQPDPAGGLDHLDYWSQDEAYAAAHHGNQGDATDPFDGVRYRRFAWDTNPGSRAYTGLTQGVTLGFAVDNIRPDGTRLRFDVLLRQPLEGHICADTTWTGEVAIDGDVVVEPGATLTLAPGTTVKVAPSDRRRSGFDPGRCELLVYGGWVAPDGGDPARFLSAAPVPGAADWGGVYLMDGQQPGTPAVQGARHGLASARLPMGATRWSGVHRIPWDLAVPPGAELVLAPGCELRFATGDLAGTGSSPRRSELVVGGRLTAAGESLRPARMTVDDTSPDSIWYGVRLLPGGQVRLTAAQIDQSGLALSGTVSQGVALAIDGCRFLRSGGGLRLSLDGTAEVTETRFSGVTQEALRVEGSGRLGLRQVAVARNGREGVYLGNCSLEAREVQLDGNGILDATDPRSGLVAVGGQGQRIAFADGGVSRSSRHGLDLDAWEGEVEVSRSQLTGNRQTGLRVRGAATVRLDQVTAEGNLGSGVTIEAAPLAATDCALAGNAAWGMILSGAASGRLERARFTGGLGLQLRQVRDLVVSGSRFDSATVAVLAQDADVRFADGHFVANATGLQASGTALPAVSGCRFTGNRVAIDNRSNSILTAADNYWGTADSAAIAALVRGPVDWLPFLAADPDSTVAPDAGEETPAAFGLLGVYPNPGAGPLVVEFAVPAAGPVELAVADATGQTVRRLAATVAPGRHRLTWDGRDERGRSAGSGVYLLRLRWEGQTAVARAVRWR